MASVLLVDDDADSSEPLAKTLRKAGHRVKHVRDGAQALTAVLKQLPELVILDLKMPVMSGSDFLEVLRSYLRFSDLPVVLFTGYDYDVARAVRLGVKQVFTKGNSNPGDFVEWFKQNLK